MPDQTKLTESAKNLGKAGGEKRAETLSSTEKSEIARKGAEAKNAK